jgi:hypothetical protein
VLETEEFRTFAKNVVLFLHNTSKVEGEPHPNFLREKGGNGYPTVSFMDHTGRVLIRQPAEKLSTEEFQKSFTRLQDWDGLRKKVAAGDAKLAKPLFLVEMDLGLLEFEAADAQLKKLGDQVTDEERAALKSRLVELEFLAHLKTIHISDKKTLVAAGKKFADMLRNDRIPQGDQKTTFWQGALTYANSKMDIELFEKILDRGKIELAGDFRLERYLKRVEKQLEQMKKAKR